MCTPWNKHKHKMMNFNTIYSGHVFQVYNLLVTKNIIIILSKITNSPY